LAPDNDKAIKTEVTWLSTFLRSANEDVAESALARLLTEIVSPLVRSVIRRRMHVSLSPNDSKLQNLEACELASDVEIRILTLLRQLKENPLASHSVNDLEVYVRAVADNVFRQYLRDKYPVRLRLKNKILYVVKHRPALATWSGEDGQTVCGRREWSGRPAAAAKDLLAGGDVGSLGSAAGSGSIDDNRRVISIIENVFDTTEAGVLLNHLIEIVSRRLGLSEPIETDIDYAINVESGETQGQLIDRIALQEFWGLMRQLPVSQRTALLLNLRDAAGDNLLAFLPILRIASIRDIAATLEMEANGLAAIWNELPLDDNTIAKRLGLSRQQVINLRQSARIMLRRMRDEIT